MQHRPFSPAQAHARGAPAADARPPSDRAAPRPPHIPRGRTRHTAPAQTRTRHARARARAWSSARTSATQAPAHSRTRLTKRHTAQADVLTARSMRHTARAKQRSTHKHARARTHKHATHGKLLHANRFQNHTVLFDVGAHAQLIRTWWRVRYHFAFVLQTKQSMRTHRLRHRPRLGAEELRRLSRGEGYLPRVLACWLSP